MTERCIQRTLKKRVRHSNVQKLPVPPCPGVLSHSQPHCSRHPAGCVGVPGLPVPWRGMGRPPCMAPASLACSPPAPGLEGGSQRRGRPQWPLNCLWGTHCWKELWGSPPLPAPLRRGCGGSNEPHFPPPSREGRHKQGLHTHTQHLPLRRGDGIRPPPPSPGETEAQRGASLTRGLCLAELRWAQL